MSIGEWSGKGWTVTVTDTELVLAQARGSVTVSGANAGRVEVRRRCFRWRLRDEGQPLVRLRGITKIEAAALSRALRRLPLAPAIAGAVAWYAVVAQLLGGARLEQRWISTEAADALVAARPEPGLLDRVRAAGCERSLTAGQLEAAGFLDARLESVIAGANEQIMVSELSSRRSFFDTIEKTPLNDEQVRAHRTRPAVRPGGTGVPSGLVSRSSGASCGSRAASIAAVNPVPTFPAYRSRPLS